MAESLNNHFKADDEAFEAFIDLLGRLIARRHRMTAGSASSNPSGRRMSKPLQAMNADEMNHDQPGQAGSTRGDGVRGGSGGGQESGS